MTVSYVVTGGGRGVGRAIVERLAGEDDVVVIVERDAAALSWIEDHPAAGRLIPVIGDAADEAVAGRAADAAAALGPLRGWVNNAAIFRDAWLHEMPARDVLGLIARNLDPVVVGCAAAIRHFLGRNDDGGDGRGGGGNDGGYGEDGGDKSGNDGGRGEDGGDKSGNDGYGRGEDGGDKSGNDGRGEDGGDKSGSSGAIVNVSSHQAQRAVRGAFAYATAKAAIEGVTRALAVDYGASGIRVNAVALGSIATERSDAHIASLAADERDRFEREIRLLQPLGRMGRAAEVADVVAFLLSGQSAFVNGAIIPIDGGRSAVGRDPEEA
ncbi:SDR family NAD(P)-dependent oxidoreductase [Paractinoplanes globisporus]|uniref:SDR family NAD(P)-dependent oxidoreductase n=1 Tax=Paractinoplanes globisporus TaxID=113565 RepID=A0ABW6WD78_9ACTN|nr:SDR family oxidoreductase [Actinoplanes globisporus]